MGDIETDLGHLEERFCDVNYASELLDILDSFLNSILMPLSCRVQNSTHLLSLIFGPSSISRTNIFPYTPEDGQECDCDDCLFIEYVELIADGGN